MPSSQLVTRALLFPLHLTVILSLHACFAGSRALRLVAHLFPLSIFPALRRRPSPPNPTNDLAAGRWTKVPKHLAVRLAPGGRGWAFWRRRDDEDKALRERTEQVRRLAGWCRELGVVTLSVYDETGLLVQHASHVADALEYLVDTASSENANGISVLRRRDEAGLAKEGAGGETGGEVGANTPPAEASESGASATLVDEHPPSSPSLSINLLSRAAGRPQLARIAQLFALERRAGREAEQLSTEAVSAAVDALPLSEPDLLFVFGGPYLRLHGFPPWQLRLTEIHHHPSPDWLAPPPLTYEVFRSALDVYGRAEMRLGR
ncbi:hypothetical protein JCM8097_008037 [Rhodosporidiobolus ruineniae]